MSPKRKKPVLVYDGNCALCKMTVHYAKAATGERVYYEPFQKVAKKYSKIPLKSFKKAIQLIDIDGKVYSAAHAAFRTMSHGGGWMWRLSVWKYKKIPGFAPLSELGYRLVANHRPFFAKLTGWLFGKTPEPSKYDLIRKLFLKILGFVYLFAFVSYGVQITGLIGSEGILPLKDYLAMVSGTYGNAFSYYLVPTIFWLSSHDILLKVVPMIGAILALFLVFGIAERFMLFLLFFAYLSLVSTGQVFMAFQWDTLLLEVGFLTFLFSLAPGFVWLLRWTLFRLIFVSGFVKLASFDQSWREFTALTFHYQTQPLPNTLAWFMHQLPEAFHRFSVAVMFIIQLVVPFLLFAPRRLRFWAAGLIALLELAIMATGNYNFFNLLTLALCLIALDDQGLKRLAPGKWLKRINPLSVFKPSRIRSAIFIALSVVIFYTGLALTIQPMIGGVIKPADYVLKYTSPFHLVNHYGLFAVMTTKRPEIIIEGSSDGEKWVEYDFKHKPGNVMRRPQWIIPHQPRLDWQMWFAALGGPDRSPWFINFAKALLDGSDDVLKLMATNPFPEAPPQFIRANVYDYTFNDLAGLKDTGDWWVRGELLGSYIPKVSLENFER